MKKKTQTMLESLANEYHQLDEERLELDRKHRMLKQKLKSLQETLQEYIGAADHLGVPVVTRINKFFITQIRKHRNVSAYEYDFIEFYVVKQPD